jgi:secretion/DNA translocation related TadE-like protein
MRASADGPAGRDRGAATLLVLAFGLFLTVAGVAAAGVGTARVGRHQARTAADLGALAGAAKAVYGPEVACARAGQFVAANHGRMASCVVDGLEIVVRAEVAVPGLGRHAVATARAGPVSALPPTTPFAEPITLFAAPTAFFAEPITVYAALTAFFVEPVAPSVETIVERQAIISVRD